MEDKSASNESLNSTGSLPAELGFVETDEQRDISRRLVDALSNSAPQDQISHLWNLYVAMAQEETARIEPGDAERYTKSQIGLIVAQANIHYQAGRLDTHRSELEVALEYAHNAGYDDVATKIQSALDSIPKTQQPLA